MAKLVHYSALEERLSDFWVNVQPFVPRTPIINARLIPCNSLLLDNKLSIVLNLKIAKYFIANNDCRVLNFKYFNGQENLSFQEVASSEIIATRNEAAE